MSSPGPDPDGPQADGPELGDLLSMGVSIALCLVVGFGLGWLVDLPLRTFPLWALVGLGLGIVAAVAFVSAQFRRYM
jgi:F0F1-type ATP synthase assembly protein I